MLSVADRQPYQGQGAAETAVVLPNVPEAVQGRERLQVPLEQRVTQAPDDAVWPATRPHSGRYDCKYWQALEFGT